MLVEMAFGFVINRKVRIMHHFKPNFLEIEILNKLGIENPYRDDEY